MRLILGSQSPRRKEILNFFSLPFVQIPSGFDENKVLFKGDPALYAETLSLEKAKELHRRFPQDLIISADTVVFFEGELFNKPENNSQAFSMLKKLSGNWHQVFTAITVYSNEKVITQSEETRILFNSLSDEQILLYHSHHPCLDKAGGYAIQGPGGLIVRKIEGCYYNVMGLPVNLLREVLYHFGIDLWRHL
jgi:septum formation protein